MQKKTTNKQNKGKPFLTFLSIFMITATDVGYNVYIGGLQPVPRDPKDNGVAAMLVVLTKGANEKPNVYDNQHGGNDVTCKPKILEAWNKVVNMQCVVPENIHNPTMEGIGNSGGVGWGGRSKRQENPEERGGEWINYFPEGQLQFTPM